MDDFHQASSQILEELSLFFETFWSQAEIDLFDDALSVILPKGQQYLINKHGVTRQVWVSSPFTGAHHFQYKNGRWRCTRTDILLEDLLMEEQKNYAP